MLHLNCTNGNILNIKRFEYNKIQKKEYEIIEEIM